jgi:hypothetical protein
MKLRPITVGLALATAASVGGVGFATSTVGAAAPEYQVQQVPGGGLSTEIPCTIAGVADVCTLTVTAFERVNGVLTAVGTVTGGNVSIPFEVPVLPATTGTCDILNLVLGPLHLDLLGLVVDLNQVVLNITAEQAPGNLLGNLLCAVAGLLDNPGNPVGGIAALLNRILSILG